jgi:hypothetical protein
VLLLAGCTLLLSRLGWHVELLLLLLEHTTWCACLVLLPGTHCLQPWHCSRCALAPTMMNPLALQQDLYRP